MTVRSVQRGRAPNCSSAGSLVGAALVSAVAGAAVFNAYAAAFAEWLEGNGPDSTGRRGFGGPDAPSRSGRGPGDLTGTRGRESRGPGPVDRSPIVTPRLRHEADGALLAVESPGPDPMGRRGFGGPAILGLDHASAEAARAAGARVVGAGDDPSLDVPGALRAPTEAHLTVTTRCPVACTACYLEAGPTRGADMDTPGLLRDIDALADLGVFEVAFGGGEAGLRTDVLQLAAHARARGMVPNLTTSGFGLSEPSRAAAFAAAFGQVNVSIDGIGAAYAAARGWDGAAVGLAAVRALAAAGARVGVNTVLTRANVGALADMADALVAAGAQEWQWLRLKPAGRGAAAYGSLALGPEDATGLWPAAMEIEARTGLPIRFDCALVPFLVMHGPDPEALRRLGVRGCVGGHSLWARAADGEWAPCSFAAPTASPGAPGPADGDAAADTTLRRRWAEDPTAQAWRARAADPPAPCDGCAYRAVCRGGCRIVAGHLTGDPLAPDPECPRVRMFHVEQRA